MAYISVVTAAVKAVLFAVVSEDFQAIKESWKAALRSGRIVEKSTKLSRREFKGLEKFLTCETNGKNWSEYVNQEEALRYELCSRNISHGRFICKGNYQLWMKVIRLISSVFVNSDGSFKKEQNLGLQWNINFVKFCDRVPSSLPHLRSVTRDNSSLEYTRKQLNYIKTTIQPFFATCIFNEFEPTQVTREKPLKLWFENKKKIIEIIKDDCILTHKQPVVIDKGRTELYFDQKYDKPRSKLSAIFDEYPECK